MSYYSLTASNYYGIKGWRSYNLSGLGEDNRLASNPGSYSGMRFDTVNLISNKYAKAMGEPIEGGGQNAPNK